MGTYSVASTKMKWLTPHRIPKSKGAEELWVGSAASSPISPGAVEGSPPQRTVLLGSASGRAGPTAASAWRPAWILPNVFDLSLSWAKTHSTQVWTPSNLKPKKRCYGNSPLLLPGKSHAQRSLAGYSPPDRRRVGHDWATEQQQ